MTKQEIIEVLQSNISAFQTLLGKVEKMVENPEVSYSLDYDDVEYNGGIPTVVQCDKLYRKSHRMVPVEVEGTVLYKKEEYKKEIGWGYPKPVVFEESKESRSESKQE